MMTVGSLFSGIGGLDLGLARAGFEIKFQVEIDPFCRRVLERHWPDVRRHDDVRTFPPDDGTDWGVDLIAGGFPCQDISSAGKRVGITGDRSGLWFEYERCIRELRPRFVLIENVSALLDRGISEVLGSLAALGFDAEWEMLSAGAFGATHFRERLFLVAYPAGERRSILVRDRGRIFAEFRVGSDARWSTTPFSTRMSMSSWMEKQSLDESPLHGTGNGIPSRVDRLGALGNAVVPQVAQWIGERILESVTS